MRSRMLWVVASAAAVSVLTACSGDDADEPATMQLPNRSGAAGSSGTTTSPADPPPEPVGTGGSAAEVSSVPARANGNDGVAAGSNNEGDAGGEEDAPVDAGGMVAAGDAGAPPPGNPPPGNPPPGNPPPGNPPPGAGSVGFSDVFPLLVANCGNCHGANAPGNRPRFAQTGNEAASFTATQATSPNGGTVAARIVARAVTTRDMPPACGRGALGTGACLDATEAAQLQTWVTQGGQP